MPSPLTVETYLLGKGISSFLALNVLSLGQEERWKINACSSYWCTPEEAIPLPSPRGIPEAP